MSFEGYCSANVELALSSALHMSDGKLVGDSVEPRGASPASPEADLLALARGRAGSGRIAGPEIARDARTGGTGELFRSVA
jgi:hypothetical protein